MAQQREGRASRRNATPCRSTPGGAGNDAFTESQGGAGGAGWNGTLLTFADLANTPQPFVEDTTIFALINYTGTWNGGLFTYGTNELADGERFTVGSQIWEIDYNYQIGGQNIQPLNFTTSQNTGGSNVTVTAVPEPGTLMLTAIGAGLAVAAGLRRRRASQPAGATMKIGR